MTPVWSSGELMKESMSVYVLISRLVISRLVLSSARAGLHRPAAPQPLCQLVTQGQQRVHFRVVRPELVHAFASSALSCAPDR